MDYGWAPFTVGRWTEWYGDQTWVPAEPFGYLTHHYGNWVLVGDRWYWAPPVVAPGMPLMPMEMVWCPGRVSWIYTGTYVGCGASLPRERLTIAAFRGEEAGLSWYVTWISAGPISIYAAMPMAVRRS